MDFSKYAGPSKQWADLVASDPSAATYGLEDNDVDRAEEFRKKRNAFRENLMREMMTSLGLETAVDIKSFEIPSRGEHKITVRRYAPRQGLEQQQAETPDAPKTLLYYHGGGMMFGTAYTEDVLCSSIAVNTRITVLSVNYRHTPIHKAPAQNDDAWDSYLYLREHAADIGLDVSNGIGIYGISAGAALSAGVIFRELARARESPEHKPIIKGAVLSIPWLIHGGHHPHKEYPFHLFVSPEKCSKIQCQDAPVLPRPRIELFIKTLDADAKDPINNVALASDEELKGWPKTAFIIAGNDPLRDEGLYFAKRLEALQIPTSVFIFTGLPHGFRVWRSLPANTLHDSRTQDSIRWTLGLGNVVEKEMETWHEYE